MNNVSFSRYADVLEACKATGPYTISVAVAEDEDVLEAVKRAETIGLADAVLVGDGTKILPLAQKIGLKTINILEAADEAEAARKAVGLIREKKADVLMKGMLNTSAFMRAVLNTEQGLKTGALLSHLAAYEIPGQKKLIFTTDGGLNINPDLADKKGILLNALGALRNIGLANPKVAVLSANEQVSPKMPSTVDARELVAMREKGEITMGIIEGPLALDIAVSPKAAEHKGIKSERI